MVKKGYRPSEEHRRKLSESLKGKRPRPETRQKISERLKEYYRTHVHHMTGTKLSPERVKQLKDRILPREGIEKSRQGRLKYFKTHPAPNEGVPHSARDPRQNK